MMKCRLVALVLVLFNCACIVAQKVTIDKITYLIEKGEACVYGADKDIEVANILSSVEYKGKSYPVTKIGHYSGNVMGWTSKGCAFMECEKLKSVIIPNSIVIIKSLAFSFCKSLTKIILPDNLMTIGSMAFAFSGLEEISIPNSVKTIKIAAFYACNLRNIIVPDLPVEIFKGKVMGNVYDAFYKCNYIMNVRCQNGNFPTYMLSYLPESCPFVLAQKYQGGNNNNLYAQNTQQPPVQQRPELLPEAIQNQPEVPSSDVDINIPQGVGNNENTFAVIIANENYQEEVKVDYALNDGGMFKEYCQKVLGLPEVNIHIRKDATLNNIKAEMTWLQKVAEAYNGQARFIVYYAGHGIPDEKSGTSYLLPVDGKGSILETGYSLKQFYAQLGDMPSAGVTVFMDACFSGSKRGDGMLASTRGVAIKAKPQTLQGNIVVFSAAQGDETAYPFKEKGHGLFTYYLLKKLKETHGNVSLGELGQFITDQVSRKSIVANGKSQTPTIVSSSAITEVWKSMKLK